MMDIKSKNINAQALVACQLNICGLSTHSKLGLEKFIYERNINILALQETRVDVLDQNCFSGMKTFINPLGHGVSLSIATTFKPSYIPELSTNEATSVWAIANIDKKATFSRG